MTLRELIFDTAESTEGVGELTETLRWGQPSYITNKPKSGTTIRLGPESDDSFALYVHCQTTLVEEFRASFGTRLQYQGNRALVWKVGTPLPAPVLKECIAAALLYHHRKRARERSR